nr:zinc finger, CCHC-type [Tanacetum cinerariifolium]
MEWYYNLRIVLSVEDKLPFLKQPIPSMPVPPAGQVLPSDVLNTRTAWVKASKEIAGKSETSSDHERISRVQTGRRTVSWGKTMTKLHAMLKMHKQTLPPKEVAPALHAIRAGRIYKSHKDAKGNQRKGKANMGYASVPAPPFAPKPKNPPTPKKDNPAKDAICLQYGEVGHWRRNCPVYLADLMKKKKLPQGASTLGIFTIYLYSFPSTSWVYGMGCGTYIFITTQGLRRSRKLRPGALSLYVGNGHYSL